MRIRARQAAKGSARDGDAGGRTYEWTGRTGIVARPWRDGLGKELCPQRRGGLLAQMRRRRTSGESVRRAEQGPSSEWQSLRDGDVDVIVARARRVAFKTGFSRAGV